MTFLYKFGRNIAGHTETKDNTANCTVGAF